jgi:hypothetical protein
MRFKRTYSTVEATRALDVHKYTLWKWGDQGKVRMYREGPSAPREFDGDEIDALAPKLRRDRVRGTTVFPSKKTKKRTK